MFQRSFERSISKQAERADNEAPNHNLILITVALETKSEHIFLGRFLANRKTLIQTKGFGAIRA